MVGAVVLDVWGVVSSSPHDGDDDDDEKKKDILAGSNIDGNDSSDDAVVVAATSGDDNSDVERRLSSSSSRVLQSGSSDSQGGASAFLAYHGCLPPLSSAAATPPSGATTTTTTTADTAQDEEEDLERTPPLLTGTIVASREEDGQEEEAQQQQQQSIQSGQPQYAVFSFCTGDCGNAVHRTECESSATAFAEQKFLIPLEDYVNVLGTHFDQRRQDQCEECRDRCGVEVAAVGGGGSAVEQQEYVPEIEDADGGDDNGEGVGNGKPGDQGRRRAATTVEATTAPTTASTFEDPERQQRALLSFGDDDCNVCLGACQRYTDLEVNGYVDANQYMTCQKLADVNEYSTNRVPLFAGPVCNTFDQYRIRIGVYLDEDCSVLDTTKDVDDYLVGEDGYRQKLAYGTIKRTYDLTSPSSASSSSCGVSCRDSPEICQALAQAATCSCVDGTKQCCDTIRQVLAVRQQQQEQDGDDSADDGYDSAPRQPPFSSSTPTSSTTTTVGGNVRTSSRTFLRLYWTAQAVVVVAIAVLSVYSVLTLDPIVPLLDL